MIDTVQNRDRWVDLSQHNSLAVPAKARKLIKVCSRQQMSSAIAKAQKSGRPFLVLGEGSNTVFVDDYDGVVIINQIKGIEVLRADSFATVSVKVAAGENWHQFVTSCVEKQWYGIENLALIPGSVGAAPIQNIGAYGVEVKDVISCVELLDTVTHEVLVIDNADCEFSYRESRFKRDWSGNKVVLSVTFKLQREGAVCLNYPALTKRLGSDSSLRDVFDAIVSIRSEKLPLPEQIPNAGSFFKNPIVNAEQYRVLIKTYPSMVAFEQAAGYKLAAAWLIENAGWKGRELNGIAVHQHQALVLINPNRKSGKEIELFARSIQKDILERYNVNLEIEPRLIK
ncbi:UDP-N-acetylmuramate dehydrogenase [Arenicella sp. 4NH20-0111]|uniref:UDP-N-acetylmuramate dehydrogenase n=1 Tax=Arenicella sp. 4NH20-0111 TaxID=3127648 RepID=UPI00310B4C99